MELPINQIIQGDCLEVLKTLPDKSVDLVLSDPPYSTGTTSTGNKGSWLDNNLIRPFFTQFFEEIRLS
jgi:site-specific DNA-methyltransferase (adenine-specific)